MRGPFGLVSTKRAPEPGFVEWSGHTSESEGVHVGGIPRHAIWYSELAYWVDVVENKKIADK